MNAPTTISSAQGQAILQVFGGRLDGASFHLAAERTLSLGHALNNDIVLRGAGTRGFRLELKAEGSRLRVRLLSGEAHMLGQELVPGRAIIVPFFVPLAIGEFHVAVGDEGSKRWQEAEELANQVVVADSEPETQPGPQERRPDFEQARQRIDALSRYAPAWLDKPATLLIAALAILILLGLAPLKEYVTRGLNTPEHAQGMINHAGFSGVAVSMDASGEALLFTGTVADDARLADLRALIADEFPQAHINVDTSAALSRAATDILAAEGVDAQARPAGLGAIVITSEYLPADRRNELRDRLQSDLPALRVVRFELTGERGPDDLAYFFNSSRFGLATYVDGAPGYLVTADGSHWFEGAVLPTGHEIVSMTEGRVKLQRDGIIENVVVDPAASFRAPASQLANTDGFPISIPPTQGANP
jgi:hypothetical protein